MPDTGQVFAPDTGRIAVIAHTHPSVSKGGAEIAAYALYEGLRRLGRDAIFIAICPVQDRASLMLGSDREFAVIADTERYDHFYHLASPDIWRQLKTILLREHVRLASFHHFLALGMHALRGLAAETDIPFAITLHEFLAICANHGQMVTRPGRRLCQMATYTACATCFPEHSRQQFAARAALIRSALEPAAAFIAPSHFLADRMVEWGLPREKFVVIENGLCGVSGPGGDAGSMSAEGADGRPWVFGYFGQITPFKGCDVLLDAIEVLAGQPEIDRRIQIRVHGNLIGQSAEFTTRFHGIFARHGFATYTGPYDNADVGNLMRACDYVLVPSTWWENSPVVIQEAYAAFCPVICTGIGGMAEKVPNRRSGLHFRLGDGADLARTMWEAADRVLYQALRSGIPPVRDERDMARDYVAIFDRLVTRKTCAPSNEDAASPNAAQRRRSRVAEGLG